MRGRTNMMKKRTAGFTLVELIMVMVIVGVVAGLAIVFVGPAFRHYATAQKRASLTHLADGALRRIVTEVHTAVPNSLRLLNGCLEMVPTSSGGRYRTAPDPTTGLGDDLDTTMPDQSFDTMTPWTTVPAAGSDWVVVGNVNGDDVYTGASRARIQDTIVAPVPAGVVAPVGHVNLTAAAQFPFGYTDGRFVVVPDSEQAVTYACEGVGTANGTGTGTLVRISRYGFLGAQQCPLATTPATTVRAIVATKVSRCNILYNPAQSAVAQSGFVQLQLTLTDQNESVSLTVGAQVENAP